MTPDLPLPDGPNETLPSADTSPRAAYYLTLVVDPAGNALDSRDGTGMLTHRHGSVGVVPFPFFCGVQLPMPYHNHRSRDCLRMESVARG